MLGRVLLIAYLRIDIAIKLNNGGIRPAISKCDHIGWLTNRAFSDWLAVTRDVHAMNVAVGPPWKTWQVWVRLPAFPLPALLPSSGTADEWLMGSVAGHSLPHWPLTETHSWWTQCQRQCRQLQSWQPPLSGLAAASGVQRDGALLC